MSSASASLVWQNGHVSGSLPSTSLTFFPQFGQTTLFELASAGLKHIYDSLAFLVDNILAQGRCSPARRATTALAAASRLVRGLGSLPLPVRFGGILDLTRQFTSAFEAFVEREDVPEATFGTSHELRPAILATWSASSVAHSTRPFFHDPETQRPGSRPRVSQPAPSRETLPVYQRLRYEAGNLVPALCHHLGDVLQRHGLDALRKAVMGT